MLGGYLVKASSNCTFMELKSPRGGPELKEGYCSNCTFMELK